MTNGGFKTGKSKRRRAMSGKTFKVGRSSITGKFMSVKRARGKKTAQVETMRKRK